ncbi:hypothetical protein OG946_24625 [Streptomyces sp. NBC_01808]|uniref:hypothetical protein n=1 Tax=Streptomyces sp. NBC_01808 TaxID=2975947 RepID=UPI002DDA1BA9|nr:hypothetical protein [Streptomyces sp. NBC_01808]WSA40270.1 hypothetical protein OG946_24625 [Streptomyces sp. NBC_01808]
MTPSVTRGATAAAATALAAVLTAVGCGSGTDGGRQGPATPSAPAATGTGPYPIPSDAAEAEPLPAGSGGTPKGGVPRPDDVDQADADAVSKGALTVMGTFDTTVDRGPSDAEVRAASAGWLTHAYAASLSKHRPRAAPGAQWQEWAGHRAYTTVALQKAEDAAKPADTDTEAWRQWAVTTTPRGRDGWTGEPATVPAYVHLTRKAAGEAWRVDDILFQ